VVNYIISYVCFLTFNRSTSTFIVHDKETKLKQLNFSFSTQSLRTLITGLQINLYLEQPMEIQLFATFFQRRK
jgi:hypothetical protein